MTKVSDLIRIFLIQLMFDQIVYRIYDCAFNIRMKNVNLVPFSGRLNIPNWPGKVMNAATDLVIETQ